jgi:hypothetical protein
MENLENGKYLLKHKMLNVGYNLIVNNNTYKILNAKTDEFIKYTTLDKVYEFCDIIKKFPEQSKMWDIAYYINGKLMETIKLNLPYPIVKNKANTLHRTTHQQGRLIPVPSK